MPSVESSAQSVNLAPFQPNDKQIFARYKGVTIKVEVINDLCELNVDAIVNAANPQLSPGGGICGAIYNKGGTQIFEDCQKYLSMYFPKKKKAEAGHVMCTNGGNLKARHVIHAVGPKWHPDNELEQKEDAKILRRLSSKILEKAAILGVEGIAIPAISTGVYGFPVEKAAHLTIKGLKDYLKITQHENLHSICIAVFKKNFNAYKEALVDTFGSSSTSEKRTIPMEKSKESQFKHLNHPLFRFYRGEGPDSNGRSLVDILDWSNQMKEAQHDYIQELFPLKEPSQFNPDAYVLDNALLNEMKQDPKVIANMKTALSAMLHFYGLRFQLDRNKIIELPNFNERSQEWLTPGNHNFLRLTRILKSLKLFGLHHEAQMLFEALKEIHERNPRITGNSFSFWQKAAAS